jgi:hypothetical protein
MSRDLVLSKLSSADTSSSPLGSDETASHLGDIERVRRLKQELDLISMWDKFHDGDKHSRIARRMRRREILCELRGTER